MMLPYVAGVSERIRKECRNYNIRVVFRSGTTFRSKKASERRVQSALHVWEDINR